MKELPIIFTAESIRSILAGKKTQTRRVIRPHPWQVMPPREGEPWWAYGFKFYKGSDTQGDPYPMKCRQGVPGDRLWVKERWCSYPTRTAEQEENLSRLLERTRADKSIDFLQTFATEAMQIGSDGPEKALYAADFTSGTADDDFGWDWKSPMFMPRRVARLFLEVQSVRVQRVQEISEEDALREGICPSVMYEFDGMDGRIGDFAETWDAINGKKPGCDWASNPWVWAIAFKVVKHEG